jgi:hypothetical protein
LEGTSNNISLAQRDDERATQIGASSAKSGCCRKRQKPAFAD